MKRAKRELIPYEAVFDHDNTLPFCVELTEQQITLLLTQTRYLYWSKRYVTNTGLDLTAEQREVIEKAAAAIESILVSAQGCDMTYTIEMIDCHLILKNNGVTVSDVDLSTCIAPPVHIGFDASNCRLMYTQGDIYSPYTGGDWISILDWNMQTFGQCLNPSQQPPRAALLDAERCDLAWGTAEQVLRDVLFIQQHVFDTMSGAPYAWAIELLADASFLARQWWGTVGEVASAIGLAEWIYLAPVPDQGMLDTYASLEAQTLLATYFYCSLSLDGGNVVFDSAEWVARMNGGFFSVNVRDAVLSYVTLNGSGDLLRNYFLYAALNTTGSDCSLMDCYALASCASYEDDFVGGLGAQTRLFDAEHDFLGIGDVQSTVAEGGIGMGMRVECDYPSNNWVGGFYVDLGLECTVANASCSYRSQFESGNYPFGLDIDYYGEGLQLRAHFHDGIDNPDATQEWRSTGYFLPVADVRYVAFKGGSSKFAGVAGIMYVANPIVTIA